MRPLGRRKTGRFAVSWPPTGAWREPNLRPTCGGTTFALAAGNVACRLWACPRTIVLMPRRPAKPPATAPPATLDSVAPREPGKGDAWAVLAILAAVVVTFGITLGFDFVMYDDNFHVTENWRLFPVTLGNLWWFWKTPYFSEYVPLTYMWYAALSWASGWFAPAPIPGLFHGGCVLLHAGCCLAVFALLRRFVAGTWAAAASALMFGLHPLQVESVAWVSETRGLLATLLGFAAMGLYLHAAERGTAPSVWRRRLCLFAAALAMALALLSKPSAVSVPLVTVALDRFWLRRSWRIIALWIAPWLLMAAALVVITKLQQPDSNIRTLTETWTRPLIAADALAFYLLKLIVPWPLGADYGRTPIAVLKSGALWWTWVVPVLAVSGIAWRGGKATRTAAVVFVSALAPVLGLAPFAFQEISTVADRYAYLALLGPAWGLAAWLDTRALRWNRQKVMGACAGVLLLMAGLSFRQSLVWRNSITLLEAMQAQNPVSFVALNNLGMLKREAGDFEEAMQLVQRAVALRPHDADAHTNLGIALFDAEQPDEGLIEFKRAVELLPKAIRYRRNLAQAHWRMGDVDAARAQFDLILRSAAGDVPSLVGLARVETTAERIDEAEKLFRQALTLSPKSIDALCGLAAVEFSRGNIASAQELYETARKFDPRHADVQTGLGDLALANEEFADAETAFRRAIEAQPNRAMSWIKLARVQQRRGESAAALQSYRRAQSCPQMPLESYLEAIPLAEQQANFAAAVEMYDQALKKFPAAKTLANNLAWLLATCPQPQQRDGARAVALAHKVLETAPSPESYDTLAAAYAAAGDFSQAVSAAKQAIELATQAGRTETATDIQTRLDLYQSQNAYVQPAPAAGP